MSYLDDLGYTQEEQRLSRALERLEQENKRLRDLHRKNLATMEATSMRLVDYGKPIFEIEVAIRETREVIG